MTKQEIQEIFSKYDFIDSEILEHGFTKNNRDYKVVIRMLNNESKEFYFVGCVELIYKNILPKQNLYLEDQQTGEEIERYKKNGGGYIWVEFSVLYPGLEIIDNSNNIAKWEKLYNKNFHHVRITTNVFMMEIIFNTIKVD